MINYMRVEPKPCKTSLAIHTDINKKSISEAKNFMKSNYKSTFDVPPHVTHLLFPMFEENFYKLLPKLEKYINKLDIFTVLPGEIIVEEKRRFFNLPINSLKLKKIHKRTSGNCRSIQKRSYKSKGYKTLK